MKQYTVEIHTTKGIDYLILDQETKPTRGDVEALFELYKNDEAGENLKGAKLLSWQIISED